MIMFSSKSDCGKFKLSFSIERVTDAPVVTVEPVVEKPQVAGTVGTKGTQDTVVYEVPKEYEVRVRKMWTENVPWEPFDIQEEIALVRKHTGVTKLTDSEMKKIEDMRRKNKLIDRLKREKVNYIMNKDAERSQVNTKEKLAQIRKEVGDEERAVIEKEGVTLKRLRSTTIVSV